MPTGVVLTYRDYEALPADGRRYELHAGQLFVTAAPGVPHQRVVGRLFALLREHVDDHRLGEVFVSPVDCILSETTIVQPDIVFVESARTPLVSTRGIEGPPTLAVEVVSRSTAQVDRGAKLQLYARLGIPCYWIVDPEQHSIDAYSAVDGVFRASPASPETIAVRCRHSRTCRSQPQRCGRRNGQGAASRVARK